MAYEQPGQLVTRPAGADLSSHQYKFVTLDASGNAILPGSTAGPSVFGVLQNKPVSGDAATIMISGISKVQAPSSTVSVGDVVAASSAGFAVPLVAGDYAVGRIVSGTSGGARVLSVHIAPIGTT